MFRIGLLLLLAPLTSVAEPIMGADHLALLSPFYGSEELRKDPPEALGVLWRTFGTDLKPLETLLETRKVKFLRIHLLNGPGLRNNQLAPNETLSGLSLKKFRRALSARDPSLLELVRSEARSVCEYLAQKFPHVTVLCSPMLEHNLSPTEFQILEEVVREAAPSVTIVNNPVRESALPKSQTLREFHGFPTAEAELISLDGSEFSSTPEHYARRFPNSKIVFWWTKEMNCRKPGPFIAPSARTACWGKDKP